MVDIEKIEKRTIQSFYEDGLTEIALGFVFLLLGGFFYAQSALPDGSRLGLVMNVLMIVVIFAGAFLARRIIRYLKRRITYPRTGYVAFKKKDLSPRRRLASAVVGGIFGASLAVLYGLAPSVKVLLPALLGLLLGVATLLFANKVGLLRFYVLAAASALVGIALTAAGIGELRGIGLYYGGYGAAVLLSGLAALAVYLRRSTPPAPDGPEAPDAR